MSRLDRSNCHQNRFWLFWKIELVAVPKRKIIKDWLHVCWKKTRWFELNKNLLKIGFHIDPTRPSHPIKSQLTAEDSSLQPVTAYETVSSVVPPFESASPPVNKSELSKVFDSFPIFSTLLSSRSCWVKDSAEFEMFQYRVLWCRRLPNGRRLAISFDQDCIERVPWESNLSKTSELNKIIFFYWRDFFEVWLSLAKKSVCCHQTSSLAMNRQETASKTVNITRPR